MQIRDIPASESNLPVRASSPLLPVSAALFSDPYPLEMWCSVVLVLCGFSALVQVSVQGPHQRTLLKNLLKDYNRMERPVGNDSHSLTVFFSISLMQIMDVDEKNQVVTTNIWLRMVSTAQLQVRVYSCRSESECIVSLSGDLLSYTLSKQNIKDTCSFHDID
uniref:Neurotransmitter-gated ion-channel ligand-binding domain-containing protein n=1 Tax=Hucho hucho TaxID=62062 RepID=A0A4W5P7E2_9TELE